MQLSAFDATSRATGETGLSLKSAMTASELRAQLLVQQARNTLAQARNFEPDKVASVATPEQATELRGLVALLFGDDTDAHQADATAAALADPDGALTSFRLLAAAKEQS